MHSVDDHALEALSDEAFRDVIGRFASGVTILTTSVGGERFGTTASAVSSLSLEPPMLLACLNRTSETRAAIHDARTFAVNILGEEQADLAKRFAVKSSSKFAGVRTVEGATGAPLLEGALAHVECRVSETATGGTHTVFLAEVIRASGREGAPLAYFRGRFGRFEDTLHDAAYQLVRGLVLNRELPAGRLIDTSELAAATMMEAARIDSALTRLAGEDLVSRDSRGGYSVTPLDERSADDALAARCALEIAVADERVGSLSPSELSELRRYAEQALAAVQADPPNISGLTTASVAFHEAFVALARNERLTDFYHRLRISSIWLRALPRGAFVDPSYLLTLTDACEAGDVAAAKRVIYDHADEVRTTARDAIRRHGGRL